jgi:hypothetical protein
MYYQIDKTNRKKTPGIESQNCARTIDGACCSCDTDNPTGRKNEDCIEILSFNACQDGPVVIDMAPTQ